MRRAENKEKRKQQILAAVEDSIRAQGEVKFSMRELAEKAGLSFATPFNLFGSKDAILIELFNRRVAAEVEQTRERANTYDALENLTQLALSSCDSYLADPQLYRPLMQAFRLNQSANPGAAAQQVLALWGQALEACVNKQAINNDTPVESLARRLHLSFRMACWMWASEQMEDAEFRQHAFYSTVACILPHLTRKGRKQLDSVLASATL